ncbi:hypothetical protein O181_011995 [Austropuccinia psidii MF-1]|uniref:Uncharacterized protein n=1 Tax=Austropuccinia psidii MF-1 TaxID=1389203 RepID=A0A9Q3BW81_9BASI|nr:hypothetical protein [Austropuccinia psidii MF-1]
MGRVRLWAKTVSAATNFKSSLISIAVSFGFRWISLDFAGFQIALSSSNKFKFTSAKSIEQNLLGTLSVDHQGRFDPLNNSRGQVGNADHHIMTHTINIHDKPPNKLVS